MGFGRAIARSFSAHGAKFFATDVDAAGLTETAQGHPMTVRAFDLTDRALAADWIGEVEAATGQAIDILVNTAGGKRGQRGSAIEQVIDEEWDALFALNVDASFVNIPSAAPATKRAGIINLGSGAAFRPSITRIQAYRSAGADAADGDRTRTLRHHGEHGGTGAGAERCPQAGQ